jgi:heterodisulfide reductase subunit A
MTAALTVADQGYEVFLVEKGPSQGGLAARIGTTLSGEKLAEHVRQLAGRVTRHPQIRLFTIARLAKVEGLVGNFETTISPEGGEPAVFRHGAAIIAVGTRESAPVEHLTILWRQRRTRPCSASTRGS